MPFDGLRSIDNIRRLLSDPSTETFLMLYDPSLGINPMTSYDMNDPYLCNMVGMINTLSYDDVTLMSRIAYIYFKSGLLIDFESHESYRARDSVTGETHQCVDDLYADTRVLNHYPADFDDRQYQTTSRANVFYRNGLRFSYMNRVEPVEDLILHRLSQHSEGPSKWPIVDRCVQEFNTSDGSRLKYRPLLVYALCTGKYFHHDFYPLSRQNEEAQSNYQIVLPEWVQESNTLSDRAFDKNGRVRNPWKEMSSRCQYQSVQAVMNSQTYPANL